MWAFGAAHQARKFSVEGAASGPVGPIRVAAPPVSQLRELFADLPYGEEAAAMVAECYTDGVTFGAGFARLLRRILSKFDMLMVDPMLPEFRRLAVMSMTVICSA